MPKVVKTQRNYFVSRGAQADYQTVTPVGTTPPLPFIALPCAPEDANLLDLQIRTVNDKGASGREFGKNQHILAWDGAVPHDLRLTSWFAAWLNRFLFGTSVSIADPGGSTNAKRHTSTPLNKNVNAQLAAFTYGEQANPSVHHFVYPSCILESAEIKGDGLGHLMAKLSIRSSGEQKTTTVNLSGGSAHVETLTGLQHFFNTQGTFIIDPGGAPVALGCQYRSFMLKYDNKPYLEDGYLPGCARFQTSGDGTTGAIRSELLMGDREIDFEYEVDLIGGELYEGHLKSQAPLDIVTKFEGATMAGGTSKHTAAYHAFAGRYSAVTRNFGGEGILRAKIVGSAFANDSDNVFESYVINDVASYA